MKSFPDAFLATSLEVDCPYCGQSSRFDFQYYYRIYQYNAEDYGLERLRRFSI